ncbi:MAG: hypothetical protein IBJ11_10655 [Phycisphaerales bacterium]|nr:hypothetical protein [Phycisphaerales bacterium]
MAFIVLLSGPKRNVVHRVANDGCKIGRGLSGTKHLSIEQDGHMSRRGKPRSDGARGEVGHAEFTRADGRWYLHDVQSENGVYVVSGGHVVQLVRGANVSVRGAALFECGQTTCLFMDTDVRPSDGFVHEVSRDGGAVMPSVAMSHRPGGTPPSTQPIESPQGEVPALLARRPLVIEALKEHGYEGLLKLSSL